MGALTQTPNVSRNRQRLSNIPVAVIWTFGVSERVGQLKVLTVERALEQLSGEGG